MTHPITQWHRPSVVNAIQTTRRSAQTLDFDAHPSSNQDIRPLLSAVDIELPQPVFFLQQVHGAEVVEYMHPPQAHFVQTADACFTRQPGIICAIMTADCLPVLLTDEAGSFVAAVHCGWRSLYAGILQQLIKTIQPRAEVLAWLGPCIQQPNYEVDGAFMKNYLKTHPDASSAFTPVQNDHCYASLPIMAIRQLNALGISLIDQDGRCTYSDDQLYSWRRDNTPQRMASLIWLKPNNQPL
ncbi:peptidoglycan editing factor PgeF [Marinicella sediminis]|uniref:Purine nucleoside phosphorylase n=1 Tax=Marinicella sediminis TaxID=1792834 RepID=A0ABV7J4U5_9GAMM|nr:peptidoglycan editing factor PgeF [Marinicella sediminis]